MTLLSLVIAAAAFSQPMPIQTADTACQILLPNDVPAEGRKSPLDSLTFSVAKQPVKVCYGRPSSRGRVMLGGDGRALRQAVANRRQRAHDPLHASGHSRSPASPVPPGTYSLYSVPKPPSGRSS